jgi:Predicted pPIWI-associating nuclease
VPRRVTPAQFRSMLRQQEQKRRRAIQNYNRAVDKYNREVRAHNARVRANRARLRSELARLARQPTARVTTTYRVSVESLHSSFVRLESAPARGTWGPAGEDLFDLAEGETANSVHALNAFLSPSGVQDDRPDLRSTSLKDELREIEPDLDQRWRGALFALNPSNPDAARHFCASSREILVSVLDIEAPDAEVLGAVPSCATTEEGRPTRRAKVEFCLARKAVASPELADFVERDLDNVSTLFGVFNKGTHGSAGSFDLDQLASLKARVEDAIRFLHRLVR